MTRPFCLVHMTMINQSGSYLKNMKHWLVWGFFNQYASKAGLTRFERFLRQVVFIIWRLWRFFDPIVEQWVTSKFFVECNFCTKLLELKLRMPEIFQLIPAWRWVWHKTSHVFSFELSEIQMKCFRCVMF